MIKNLEVLAHADWSSRHSGRWLVKAERAAGRWRIREPSLFDSRNFLRNDIGEKGILGVDVPIGVPAYWADQAKIYYFPQALLDFGSLQWSDTLRPAEKKDEISIFRPFYPAKPGGAKQAHLLAGLGVNHMDILRRRCDFDQEGRSAATPLFWTLGAAQVGKAAINFWLDVLKPAIQDSSVLLWPFEGDLVDLIGRGKPIVAETYPAEAYRWFDLEISKINRSKRRIDDRRLDASRLIEVASNFGIDLEPAAEEEVVMGFPAGGDDAFDAFVGVLAVASVVSGQRPEAAICDDKVRRVEGWILGRRPAPITLRPKSL
ncbi:MAG: hypothetical protein VW620_12915 [Rhodospirillales bacterium]